MTGAPLLRREKKPGDVRRVSFETRNQLLTLVSNRTAKHSERSAKATPFFIKVANPGARCATMGALAKRLTHPKRPDSRSGQERRVPWEADAGTTAERERCSRRHCAAPLARCGL